MNLAIHRHLIVLFALLACGRTFAVDAPSADSIDRETIHYLSGDKELIGFLYKPKGDGPFPVFLWNHGSEREPKTGAAFSKFWVPQGFVVFAPIRSGHGSNPGEWIMDQQKHVRNPDSREGFHQLLALHERANNDVVAAYRWIATQPFVDSKRIVVAGGSFGGIQTLLTAERDSTEHLGVKCFVAMAPAAQSWRNPNWASTLSSAVDKARAPIFILQAQNDYDLGPSEKLGPRLTAKVFPNRYKIFPAHGDPNDHQQGHAGFYTDPEAWGDDVRSFLHDCGAD